MTISADLRRGPAALVAVPIAVLLGYTYGIALPGAGLDQGWQLGLSMARLQGLDWGRDLAFTYGPWGLLNAVAPLSGGLVLQALLGQIAVLTLTAFGAWRLSVERGRWTALVLAVLVAGQAGALGYATTFGLAVTLLSLCWVTGRLEAMAWSALLGVLSGVALLVKFNVGVTALAIVGLAVTLGPRAARAIPSAAVGVAVGGVGGWLLAGQPLGAALGWLRQSVDVAVAYSTAMGHSPAGRPGLPAQWAVLSLAAACGLLIVAWLATQGQSRRVRMATILLLALAMTSAYLASATRLDAGHAQFLLVTTFVVGVPVAAAVQLPQHRWLPWLLVFGVAIAELAVGTAVVGRSWHTTVLHPTRSVRDLRLMAEQVVNANERRALLAEQRTTLTTAYQNLLPEWERETENPAVRTVAAPQPAVIHALRGARVHAEPWAVGLVWANRLRWQPVPVFQTYSAYTPLLDRTDARALASPTITGVLRQSAAIDGKNPLWESPRYQLQLLCRFREVAHDDVWQALRRVPERCARPHRLRHVSVDPGQQIRVPSVPGSLVIADLRLRGGGPGIRGAHPALRCDGRNYRLAQGFPSGPLVMDASATGWSPTHLPAPCRTITPDAGVDIEFRALAVTPVGT